MYFNHTTTPKPAATITGAAIGGKRRYYMNNLIGLSVITDIRPQIGVTKYIKGDYVGIEYVTLGFTEEVNFKMVNIIIVNQ